MNFKKSLAFIKKNRVNIIFIILLGVFLFSTNAKSWVLQQLISTGVFNAEIIKGKEETLPAVGAFSYADLHGRVSSTSVLRGKVVFINFWASWCPPCRAEMPSLVQLYSRLKKDTTVVFLFINEDEDPEKGIRFLQKNHFDIPFYVESGTIPGEIFSGTLPTTIVINKEGEIALKHQGMAGFNTDTFIRQLREM